jgi:hypothetical protein
LTFRYKDHADAHQRKAMTLSAEEFLRRFVQHVLPRGFVKMRHYGLLANRHRQQRLEVCRRLLLVATVAHLLDAMDCDAVEPQREPCCPKCGGRRFVVLELSPAETASGVGSDTS